jgi:hypothetical protein
VILGLSAWGLVLQAGPFAWFGLFGILPAAWVVYDARRIHLLEYRTSLSNFGPMALFLITVLLWVTVLPWYLTVREQIRAGHVSRMVND